MRLWNQPDAGYLIMNWWWWMYMQVKYTHQLEKVVSPFCVEVDICLHSFGWSSSQIFKTSTTSVCVYGYVYGNCCLTRKNPEQSKKINVSVRQTDWAEETNSWESALQPKLLHLLSETSNKNKQSLVIKAI
jgi:apolipoprotein N-acyltransferase